MRLLDFIRAIEDVTGCKARMRMLPMQAGDVVRTYADTSLLEHDFSYKPSTPIREGLERLYEWIRGYGAI